MARNKMSYHIGKNVVIEFTLRENRMITENISDTGFYKNQTIWRCIQERAQSAVEVLFEDVRWQLIVFTSLDNRMLGIHKRS